MEHDPELVKLAKSKGIDVVQGFTETEDTVIPGDFTMYFCPLISWNISRIR